MAEGDVERVRPADQRRIGLILDGQIALQRIGLVDRLAGDIHAQRFFERAQRMQNGAGSRPGCSRNPARPGGRDRSPGPARSDAARSAHGHQPWHPQHPDRYTRWKWWLPASLRKRSSRRLFMSLQSSFIDLTRTAGGFQTHDRRNWQAQHGVLQRPAYEVLSPDRSSMRYRPPSICALKRKSPWRGLFLGYDAVMFWLRGPERTETCKFSR